MLILISGVVLLTHKKPDPSTKPVTPTIALTRPRKISKKASASKVDLKDDEDEDGGNDEERALWAVGDVSEDDDTGEDDDIDHHQNPLNRQRPGNTSRVNLRPELPGEEGQALIKAAEAERARTPLARRRSASYSTVNSDDDFGEFTTTVR